MVKRVVVTGIGAISGNGSSVPEIWKSISQGHVSWSKIDPKTHFDISSVARACSRGKEVIDTACASRFSNSELAKQVNILCEKHFDRHQLFAYIAADEAMYDSRLFDHKKPERFGCVVGTGDGGLTESFNASKALLEGRKLSPYSNLRHLPGLLGGYLAQRYRLRGPSHVHTTACAASAHALMQASDLIKLGRADVVLCGGSEATITPLGVASFCAQRAISNASLPYQKDRTGFLMGEGAAMLVLEEYQHAVERNAKIYAEICGYGASSDGDPDSQITDPKIDGGALSAQSALLMANIDPSDVGYINTHGTGTPIGDVAELAGIQKWLNRTRPQPFISSTKSYSGHLFGAAGAYEAVLTILMMVKKLIIPTLGLSAETIDPACEDTGVLLFRSVEARIVDYALSNSFGFGGTNASIIFGRMPRS